VSEAEFQSEFIKEFIDQNWYSVHLSPPSCAGWVDVISIKSPYSIQIELKDFFESDLNRKFKELFTTAQFPRYIQQFELGIGCIWIALQGYNDDYYCVPIFDQKQLMTFWKMNTKTAISKMLGFTSVKGMVKFMIDLTAKPTPIFLT